MSSLGKRDQMPSQYNPRTTRKAFRDASHHLHALAIAYQASRLDEDGELDERLVEWTARLEAEFARVSEAAELMLDAIATEPAR